MRIEHVAIWTKDIDRLKEFYVRYFNGTAGSRYKNPNKQYESYFVAFDSGARLELMQMPSVSDDLNAAGSQHIGITHIAFTVGGKETVDSLTEELRKADYCIAGEPRHTGDGYYESCVLDPDGNRIEITA